MNAARLQRVLAPLVVVEADCVVNARQKYLAVTDLPRGGVLAMVCTNLSTMLSKSTILTFNLGIKSRCIHGRGKPRHAPSVVHATA